MKKALLVLDILRIAAVGIAFFFGYQIGFSGETYDPLSQIHFMVPILIPAVAGTSGLEGLLFSRQSAEGKGFETGSNYQKQSAFAMLSLTAAAFLVYFAQWGLFAELTVLFVFCLFLLLSGINHAMDAVKNRNYRWQNINRPFITLLMLMGLVYPVIQAL